MNEMQALIDRRDEVVARLEAIEREPAVELSLKDVVAELSNQAASEEAFTLSVEK
ncbi:MAG: hypothetical protein KAT25_05635 [Sulfuriflexus sp.]|nr:hypothetical protein [Sulfuriflexus sp.]